MLILGISAFYHDSAACLLRDGRIVAAAQEERFSRIKHDADFPAKAAAYCLSEGGIGPGDVDYVAFYDKPILKFDRLLQTYLDFAPHGFRSFLLAMPQWLRRKLHLPREIARGLGAPPRNRLVFTEHHEAHAASAFFPSPFAQAAILTMDGVGEWATASFGVGRGNRIELTHELRFPDSLGLLYSAFTYFTGFKVNSGEYKLMGLAPYGRPIYRDRILQHLIDLKKDGSFRMDQSFFDYCAGLTMTSAKFERLFDGPPRPPEGPITAREMDLAASIQSVTEEIVLRCARHVARVTGMRKLVLAGGVALNCVANGRILAEGIFDDLWIQPAAGDAGGALGAALFVWHQLLENGRVTDEVHDFQQGSFLGPAFGGFTPADVPSGPWTSAHCPREEQLLNAAVDALIAGKVVGWFQGRMEFGPRALGCRSILGDPRSPAMQSLLNRRIKFRESFRPFAPAVMAEHAHEWFELARGRPSPYMLLVAGVHPSKRLAAPNPEPGEIDDRLKAVRSQVPAITHVDYSARIQTVDEERHGRFYRLIRAFHEKTGCPMLINTSFNVRDEPIVCTPAEALRCFLATGMDLLVVEDYLITKTDAWRSAPAGPGMAEQGNAHVSG